MLDRLSLPAEEFEVVWSLRDPTDAGGRYLAEVVGRRPNMRITSGPGEALADARGDYVLAVTAADHLYPAGLPALVAFAREHDLDTAAARTTTKREPIPAVGLTTATDLDPDRLQHPALAVLVRRSLARFDSDDHLVPVGRAGLDCHGAGAAPTRDPPLRPRSLRPSPPRPSPLLADPSGSRTPDRWPVTAARWEQGELVVDCADAPDRVTAGVLEHRVGRHPVPGSGRARSGPAHPAAGRPAASGR